MCNCCVVACNNTKSNVTWYRKTHFGSLYYLDEVEDVGEHIPSLLQHLAAFTEEISRDGDLNVLL